MGGGQNLHLKDLRQHPAQDRACCTHTAEWVRTGPLPRGSSAVWVVPSLKLLPAGPPQKTHTAGYPRFPDLRPIGAPSPVSRPNRETGDFPIPVPGRSGIGNSLPVSRPNRESGERFQIGDFRVCGHAITGLQNQVPNFEFQRSGGSSLGRITARGPRRPTAARIQGAEPPIPIPVPVPDVSAGGMGNHWGWGSHQDLPGIGGLGSGIIPIPIPDLPESGIKLSAVPLSTAKG